MAHEGSGGAILPTARNGFAENLGLRGIQVLALQGVEVRVLFWHQVYTRKPAEILEKFRVRVRLSCPQLRVIVHLRFH